ncbi:MAG TPA: gfo/Idh/MocA family oxidoreductase, partial [Isosphaeraceae bacterium]|nr:gfo/Idh/MocA family oxidoreductase [Isosphaeraceae bacterium]
GDIFYGTEGILAITSYESWQVFYGRKLARGGYKLEKGPSGSGGCDHFANFVKAVRARDCKLLNADIEQGHLSSAYCHLGNIAYRLGRKLHINPSTESFVNDSEADAMLTREYRRPYVVPAKV